MRQTLGFLALLAACAGSTCGPRAIAAPPPWEAMDYGPFLTASIESPSPRTNIAYKGIAVNVGRAAGGADAGLLFDTDLLRYASGWTAGFVALKGIVFDGEHWAYPQIQGRQALGNPMKPGWAHGGSFDDPREQPFGPVPRSHAHWKGLYLHDRRVVFSYRVGDMDVLEEPALERQGTLAVFTRTLNVGASASEQVVQVAFEAGREGRLRSLDTLAPVDASTPAGAALVVQSVAPDAGGAATVLATAAVGLPTGARWVATATGDVRLRFPAHDGGLKLKLLIWRGNAADLTAFARFAKATPAAADLAPATRGGPARWAERLTTKGRLGANDGPYAIDELTAPDDNPWNSWLRFGGLDFFSDGTRAAICTWNGDVWIVSGVDGSLERLTWQRIATGLFQPLGLKIVDDEVYVLGRDQVTRLRDLDGDGETDFYENFNNDGRVSEHFHEFATDLKLGPDGDFYYLKCARHALPAAHADHGTLMKLSRDGSKLDVVARGFRAVNGLGVGPRGELTSVDNQGHWMPANRINWIRPGGWYGNQWAWNPSNRTTYDEPLCWVHNFVDRSGGTHLWVPTDAWGAMKDQLITLSYGMGHMFLVLKEEVDGVMQGALTRFPLEFETGVMRGVFHPQNGQLYACGLYGWAGNKTRPGAFHRVRFTGKPLNMPERLRVARDGIVLGFTDPLDPDSATDSGNYDLKAWNYRWSAQYGSPDLRLDGREGRDSWRIESATLSADRRTVFLRVPEVQPVMQVHLVFNLRTAAGGQAQNFVHGTIHRTGALAGAAMLGDGAIARAEGAETRLAEEAPGLTLSLNTPDDTAARDLRVTRLAAIYVPSGTPASPMIEPGPFQAKWSGFLKVELNEEIRFRAEGRGRVRLRVQGGVVLESKGDPLPASWSDAAVLRRGLNRFELEYDPPGRGDAELRLLWKGRGRPDEPVPPTAFVHEAADPALEVSERLREGRSLFAELKCGACHGPDEGWGSGAMPELAARAAALDGAGERFKEDWMTRWLLDPQALRPDARMPRLFNGPDAAGEARDVAAYLASPKHARGEVAPSVDAATAKDGARMFADLGCVACHLTADAAQVPNETRISLARVPEKWRPGALTAFLRHPSRDHAWTRMPDFKLSTTEAAELTTYLLAQTAKPGDATAAGADPGVAPASATRGERLVRERGCLACHGIEGLKNSATAPRLTELQQADGRRGCLAESAAERGRAPTFALAGSQRAALHELWRKGGFDSLRRDVTVEFAERQHRVLRCNACHGRDGEPDALSMLAPVPSKGAGAGDEEGGSVHVGRPALTLAGEKLYAGWMERFIGGTLPYKPRSELQGRMPAFAAQARGLAEGMAHQHGYPAVSAPAQTVDPQLAEAGRRLTQVEGGFSCVSCHDVGAQKALAGKDTATVNFAYVADRLRRPYYWRYVQDPTRLVPGTMMPKFIGEDGTTPIKSVFDGDPNRQFEAVWHYLHSLRFVAKP